jgi:nicotinamidase-related amidase
MGNMLRVPYKMLSAPLPLEPLHKEKAALILMDFQKYTCSRKDGLGMLAEIKGITPEMDEYYRQVDAAVENAFHLLESCRNEHVTVIFTYLHSAESKKDISRQFQTSELPIPMGDLESEFHKTVKPIAGERILTRGTYSPFLSTDLLDILRKEGKDTLVIAGMLFNYTVFVTAREAADLGFNVIVVWDASASETLDWHLVTRTGLVGGLILSRSAEEVIEMMEGTRT